MADLSLQNVAKRFGDQLVINGVDLEVADGELVVLVGPSGCGKSTLLRMIAGLEEVSGGTVHIAGRDVTNVAPAKRGVAMVFQTYALYPHMSVYKNMAFGLKQAKTPSDEIDRRVREAADVLQITELLERRPRALSGGQRQRVAIGRAIVREPEVFLFDEPLSNLDAALRVQTRLEIARLHQSLDATMVYVTHDQVEAMTLADRIVVLRDGHVEQIGTPIELYNHPDNMFVAGFIGSPKMNFLSPQDLSPHSAPVLKQLENVECVVGVRPEHLAICAPEDASFEATLELVEHLGEYVLVHMTTKSGAGIIVKSPMPPETAMGSLVSLAIDLQQIHVFDLDSETRL